MAETVRLTAGDGFELDAYVARPTAAPTGGLVVVQEIFGVNSHIRGVADDFAREGFLAIAPALFDRYEPGVELGYEGEDLKRAMSFVPKLNIDNAVKDVDAALSWLRLELTGKRVGVIGYCFGGTVAWLAATRLRPNAAVGYYGGRIGQFAEEALHAPVMLHFGERDAHIPREEVAKVQAAHPEVQIFWYDAGHGFNCDQRASYQPEAARVARERSLQFFKQHLVR